MFRKVSALSVFVLATPLLLATDKQPTPQKPVKPRWSYSKDATFIDGPLDANGYIDYETALNQRLSKGVTPENNAVVLIWKTLGPRPEGGNGMPPEFFKWLGLKEPPLKGDYFVDLERYLREQKKMEELDWEAVSQLMTQTGKRPWKSADHPEIAAWLKLNEKPLVIAVEASRRSHYFNPLVTRKEEGKVTSMLSALLPATQKCRSLGFALTARAMLHLGEGRPAEAWQDLQACHRLARHVSRGATLIELLVGIALDAIATESDYVFLAECRWNSQQLEQCLRDLQNLPPLRTAAEKIDLGERFCFLDSVRMLSQCGPKALEALMGTGTAPKPDEKPRDFNAINWEPAMINGNRWYNRMVEACMQKTRAERKARFEAMDQELRQLKTKSADPVARLTLFFAGNKAPTILGEQLGNVLISLLIPAVSKVQDACDRAEQFQRNLQLAVALAAYRADHKNYPKSLDPLAPRYIKQVPGDVFSGEAMLYRPDSKGYLLYSVGLNGRDDNGQWMTDDPAGDDPRVRMPLPALKVR